MNEIGSQLGVLYEQIKASEFQIESAKQTIADSQSGIDAAQGEVTRITALVRERAASVYRKAGLNGVGEFETGIRQQASRRKYAERDQPARRPAPRPARRRRRKTSPRSRTSAEKPARRRAEAAGRAEVAGSRVRGAAGRARQDQGRHRRPDRIDRRRRAGQATRGRGGRRRGSEAREHRDAKRPTDRHLEDPAGERCSRRGGRLRRGPARQALLLRRARAPTATTARASPSRRGPQAGVYMPGNSEAQFGSFPRVPLSDVPARRHRVVPRPRRHLRRWRCRSSTPPTRATSCASTR